MIVFKKASALSLYLQQQTNKQRSIGFVPTMGALHAGHLSLLQKAKVENDIAVCSIFVNPTQFNNAEDYKHYPVTIEKDLALLAGDGCDVLFLPSVEEVYPAGHTKPHYDLGHLETLLEGAHRPGHFQGVCQVVERLLQLVRPAKLYLGQKDYQQCMVIERLLQLAGLDKKIQLVISPTLREESGLAMSSRNLRLNAGERQAATALYKALVFAKENLRASDGEEIKATAISRLLEQGFLVDYFEIADAKTLLSSFDQSRPLVALVAAHLGAVRLIDNLSLN